MIAMAPVMITMELITEAFMGFLTMRYPNKAEKAREEEARREEVDAGEVGVGVSVHEVISSAQETEEGVGEKKLCVVERCWFCLEEDVSRE